MFLTKKTRTYEFTTFYQCGDDISCVACFRTDSEQLLTL